MFDPTREEMVSLLESTFREYDVADLEQAIYFFAMEYHGGQDSNLYSALSTSPYKPGACQYEINGEISTDMFMALVELWEAEND